MYKIDSHESITFVKVSELLKIVDQLYIDQMEYARLVIHYDNKDENLDGSVHISGIPSFESSEPAKQYSIIHSADLPNCYL